MRIWELLKNRDNIISHMTNSTVNNSMEVITTEIKCPNCRAGTAHSYTEDNYGPVYCKCWFCDTLYRWTKTCTKEIVAASQKHFNYEKPLEL